MVSLYILKGAALFCVIFFHYFLSGCERRRKWFETFIIVFFYCVRLFHPFPSDLCILLFVSRLTDISSTPLVKTCKK